MIYNVAVGIEVSILAERLFEQFVLVITEIQFRHGAVTACHIPVVGVCLLVLITVLRSEIHHIYQQVISLFVLGKGGVALQGNALVAITDGFINTYFLVLWILRVILVGLAGGIGEQRCVEGECI